MKILAVKFRKDGYSIHPFAFGEKKDIYKFDKNIHYCGRVQNYVMLAGNKDNKYKELVAFGLYYLFLNA